MPEPVYDPAWDYAEAFKVVFGLQSDLNKLSSYMTKQKNASKLSDALIIEVLEEASLKIEVAKSCVKREAHEN